MYSEAEISFHTYLIITWAMTNNEKMCLNSWTLSGGGFKNVFLHRKWSWVYYVCFLRVDYILCLLVVVRSDLLPSIPAALLPWWFKTAYLVQASLSWQINQVFHLNAFILIYVRSTNSNSDLQWEDGFSLDFLDEILLILCNPNNDV